MSFLTGPQLGELRDILCDVYPEIDELSQMVRIRLNETLGNIVAVRAQPNQNIAFALLEWLEARNRTRELLAALLEERPRGERVLRFCEPLLAAGGPGGRAPPTEPPDPNLVRTQVIEFSAVFGERRKWFNYLRASKALHDVLHKLQAMQEGIAQAIERFRLQPNAPVELEIIANTLDDDFVANAVAANQETEFPDEAGEWITAFRGAVRDLRAALAPPDLVALKRCADSLRALPDQQQAGLNKELVRYVYRLKADELVTRMDGILAGLGQIPAAAELQSKLTQFRALCKQLAGLILDHDACQEVEISLKLVPRSGEVSHDQVFNWPNVLAALLRIAGRRPADPMAARMAEYARAFDAALPNAGSAPFALLRQQFSLLFHKTDDVLLTVTDKLVAEAANVDARLRSFA